MKSKTNNVPVDERINTCLYDNHVHFLYGEINEYTVTEAIKWIVYENANDDGDILTLYVNSTGGDLYQAFALVDIMKISKKPICTIGIGQVMSAAFLIFTSGTRGMRIIGKNTGIMCHQYSEATEDVMKFHDLRASMHEGDLCNNRMLDIIQSATQLPMTKVKSILLRESDVYLTAEQAVEYQVADAVLSTDMHVKGNIRQRK